MYISWTPIFNEKEFKTNRRDRPSQIKFVKYELTNRNMTRDLAA